MRLCTDDSIYFPNKQNSSYSLEFGKVECCFADLFKMVCEKGENVLDITIPVVMLPVDAGRSLENIVKSNSTGSSSFESNCTSAEILLLLVIQHILS